jgi:hypothetical protein
MEPLPLERSSFLARVSQTQWREAIEELWKHDPDPDQTLAIQTEINAAFNRGDIAYATDRSGKRIGYFYCCPWSPIYVVKSPVTIAGQRLRTLQEFTFVVDADEVLEGREFERKTLVASFQPTSEIGYCNPHEGRHHWGSFKCSATSWYKFMT